MTTNTATNNTNTNNPQDVLDFALLAGKVHYINGLVLPGVTLEDLDALRAPWLNLPVDYVNASFIYQLMDDGATIRNDTGLTDAELIGQIKGALNQFIELVNALENRNAETIRKEDEKRARRQRGRQ